MIETIKKVLDLGLSVESKNFKMTKTNSKHHNEYSLENLNGKIYYYYDEDYNEAIDLLIADVIK